MPRWQNWSGKLESDAAAIHFIRSEADACALAAKAADDGVIVRGAGATHSHAPLVQTQGIVADLQALSGVISTEGNSAWVWAGSRIFALGPALHQAGLALHNQGDIDQQAIAGATATGTHGTGPGLKNLSAAVRGVTLATAAGELRTFTEADDEFQAMRQHLGAFGLVTRLLLDLEPAYKLREETFEADLDALLDLSRTLSAKHRHFEFFWYPQTNKGRAKTIDRTDQDPEYPLATEGSRCAWSYEVLPNHRPHRHTEMEYSVPADNGIGCMQDIAHLLRTQFPDISWPVEYRTLAADDVWLSSAYKRPTVTVSVHQDVRLDDEPYFRACEDIFLSHGGRPHWGKVNYLDGEQLATRHAKWSDWWHVRDQLDPKGTFINEYMRTIRP